MERFEDFIGSFSFDQRLARHDIEGSIAHVTMLVARKIIAAGDGKKIIAGLKAIQADLNRGKSLPQEEDIHYAVERELIRRIGPVGGKMHTARSRNDQVALDLRLYLRQETRLIIALIRKFHQAVVRQAVANTATVMPGYTHLQPAQPVVFAHHILAYGWMLQRDAARFADCLKRTNILPLGSAALAGTSFPIDRQLVARLLAFDGITENSLDAVSDRDFAIEFLSCAAQTMMHLSRLCEELVLWSSVEFGFVRLADQFTSGSSIMPQKRNPDSAEIVRGKTGRVVGDLVALVTLMKGLPLAYNRDMQEDKPPVFDAVDTLKMCLDVTTEIVRTMRCVPERMRSAVAQGYLEATELADYLARKGVPFREAHGVVKKLVQACASRGIPLQELTPVELRAASAHFGDDVRQLLCPESIVRVKSSAGGTAPGSIKKQIEKLRALCR